MRPRRTITRIPWAMTHGRAPQVGPDAATIRVPGAILGPSLSLEMVAYLDACLAGLSRRERLTQLEEIDGRAARAWYLHESGKPVRQIAEMMQVSESTARRLVHVASRFLFGAGDDDRVAALARKHPHALSVWMLTQYGWRQDAIADTLSIPERTVRRLLARARVALADVPARTIRRLADDRIGNTYPASPSEIAELRRLNAPRVPVTESTEGEAVVYSVGPEDTKCA